MLQDALILLVEEADHDKPCLPIFDDLDRLDEDNTVAAARFNSAKSFHGKYGTLLTTADRGNSSRTPFPLQLAVRSAYQKLPGDRLANGRIHRQMHGMG
ncbi:hypothetical protein ABBQ38_005835 [Trebouxia sp. C0009 RCD-2024]